MIPNRKLLLATGAAWWCLTTAAPGNAADTVAEMGAPTAAAIPVEQFFRRSAIAEATISPDGRYVAVRQLSAKGRLELAIVDAAARTSKTIVSPANADVRMVYWVSEQRLVFTVNNLEHGGEIRNPGLYAIDRDGKQLQGLSPTIERDRSFAEDTHGPTPLQNGANDGFAPPANQYPVQIRYPDQEEPELARIDTRSGITTPVIVPRGTFAVVHDPSGKPQVATTSRKGRHAVFFRDGSGWNEVAQFDPEGADALNARLYVDNRFYVTARPGGDTRALYLFDLQNKKLAADPVIVAAGFDIDGGAIVDDKALLGYRFPTDAQATVWFDPVMKAVQEEVDRLLPATVNNISRGRSSQTPYVLIDAWAAQQQHQFSIYNRETKQRVMLAAPNQVLQAPLMAEMSMPRYRARDGLEMPIFVTVPQGTGDKKKLPTVVLVPSQPWSREASWAWDPEVQFLASRGYVVLQPQARGVQGFGARHASAGNAQWGLAMQDDLADAVRWAVAQGYTDPARVCIAGTGYGGYAAMMGLVKDPDVFQCGISWSGITDIGAMFNSGWDHFIRGDQKRNLARLLGDPRRDAERFRQTSPLANAARIKRPVLLAYGTTDKAVPYADGKKFYEAVKAGNPAVEWLSYTPAVEDWTTQKNRIDLWRHIEQFLGQHIGPKGN